jgi:DHA1 family multidrug resistance protein-like MFS transporter
LIPLDYTGPSINHYRIHQDNITRDDPMALDNVDRSLEAVERDAALRRSEEIERVVSASSVSTSSSDASHRGAGLNRVETQRDLERHQTELSRIHTARSQHSGTVGRKDTKGKEWKRPLPNFGAGKPYPPLLPNQEDYVVEFDGPDDPLHAQNWPIKKKYVLATLIPLVTPYQRPRTNTAYTGSSRPSCSVSPP